MQYIDDQLKKWQANHLMRTHRIMDARHINFSSNDYLGLSHHQKIQESLSNAIKKYGLGSGGSALVCGYSDAHAELESAFANWLNVDKTLFFNSGYAGNMGAIQALCQRNHIIYSDKLCHASLLDGIQLSRARHIRYQHNNIQHLQRFANTHHPDWIITESVFSMQGDIAPIKNLSAIAKKFQAGLLIDDAHGIGWLGSHGKGIIEASHLTQNNFTVLTLPLGKSFNAIGCIVAGKNHVIEAILQFSKTYRYTTAMPAAICAALKTTLQIIVDENHRREKLKENIKLFHDYAVLKNIALLSSNETPIQPILIGSTKRTIGIHHALIKKGFYTLAALPPTVPNNQSCLRISINANHTASHIFSLLDAISTELSCNLKN